VAMPRNHERSPQAPELQVLPAAPPSGIASANLQDEEANREAAIVPHDEWQPSVRSWEERADAARDRQGASHPRLRPARPARLRERNDEQSHERNECDGRQQAHVSMRC
jgi:hypothetical protein